MPFNVAKLVCLPQDYKFDPNTDWKNVRGYEDWDIADPNTWVHIDNGDDVPDESNLAPFTVYSPRVMNNFLKTHGIQDRTESAKALAFYLPANLSTTGVSKTTNFIQESEINIFKSLIKPALCLAFEEALDEKRVAEFLLERVDPPGSTSTPQHLLGNLEANGKQESKNPIPGSKSLILRIGVKSGTLSGTTPKRATPVKETQQSGDRPTEPVVKLKLKKAEEQDGAENAQGQRDRKVTFLKKGTAAMSEELAKHNKVAKFKDKEVQQAANDTALIGAQIQEEVNGSDRNIADTNDTSDTDNEIEYCTLSEKDLVRPFDGYKYKSREDWGEVNEDFEENDPTSWCYVNEEQFGDHVLGRPLNPHGAYHPNIVRKHFEMEGIQEKESNTKALHHSIPMNVSSKGTIKANVFLNAKWHRIWVHKYASRASGVKRTHEEMVAGGDDNAHIEAHFDPRIQAILKKLRRNVKKPRLDEFQNAHEQLQLELDTVKGKYEALDTTNSGLNLCITQNDTTISELTGQLNAEKQKSKKLGHELQVIYDAYIEED